MQMTKYLAPERVVFLTATSKEEAIREMLNVLCRHDPGLDADKVMEALLRREKILSSRIAPSIALPHALLPDYGKPVAALGYSPEGIPWDSPGGEPVNLVILSLCGRAHGREHVAMMADIANTLIDPSVMERIGAAGSPEAIYEILRSPHAPEPRNADPQASELSRAMMEHAESMARNTGARAVLFVTDGGAELQFLQQHRSDLPLIIATRETGARAPSIENAPKKLYTPGYGLRRTDRVRLALLFALSAEMVNDDDTVICLSGDSNSDAVNVLEVIDLGRESDLLLSFRSKLQGGDVSPHVFYRVLQIADSLACEGREGKPVGTIFIIGDYQNVRQRCYQMVINPFRGYPENERNVLDPALEETVKEFSRVDGASLIRGDGIIMSLGAYIQAEEAARGLQSGLGTRHAAGMAITMSTSATSIVLSESTRGISIYQKGGLVTSLKRARRN